MFAGIDLQSDIVLMEMAMSLGYIKLSKLTAAYDKLLLSEYEEGLGSTIMNDISSFTDLDYKECDESTLYTLPITSLLNRAIREENNDFLDAVLQKYGHLKIIKDNKNMETICYHAIK